MANTDAPRGLLAVAHGSGAPYNNAVRPYYVPDTYATALFIGDPVVVTGTSNTAQVSAPGAGTFEPGTLPEINQAAAAGPFSGVIVGFAADPTNLETVHRPASTERIAFVADDPDLLFEIQEDSVGGALAATSVGLNANVILGTGSTATGLSGAELDSNTAATTSTLALRIVGLAPRADNAIGNQAKWLVKINDHAFLPGTGI